MRMNEKLIYLTTTMPDISFVVGLLSQLIYKPTDVHWKATVRVLAYITALLEKRFYKKHGHVRISVYSDAGYTRDKNEMKSNTGFLTFIMDNLVN